MAIALAAGLPLVCSRCFSCTYTHSILFGVSLQPPHAHAGSLFAAPPPPPLPAPAVVAPVRAEVDIPNLLLCPISQELIRVPVMLQCGHTFDRASIEPWLQLQSMCPMSCELKSKELLRNLFASALIDEFRALHGLK